MDPSFPDPWEPLALEASFRSREQDPEVVVPLDLEPSVGRVLKGLEVPAWEGHQEVDLAVPVVVVVALSSLSMRFFLT